MLLFTFRIAHICARKLLIVFAVVGCCARWYKSHIQSLTLSETELGAALSLLYPQR